jgi:Cell Wall Hydrolase
MRQLRIRGLAAARGPKAMRQLRIRELPAAGDTLGKAFIAALVILALSWGYQLRQVNEERDYLIRTIAFEASGEPEIGKIAVAYVVLNRKKSGKWGDNIKAVVTSPHQFEPWMKGGKAVKDLSPHDPRYKRAAKIADAVLSGQTTDPTGGSTHFLNPIIVQARRGGSLPPWARGEGRPIGRHTFYSPDAGDGSTRRATRSVGATIEASVLPTPRRDR